MATRLKLKIDRMMCGACVKKVTDALSVPGISDLDVRIGRASLVYDEGTIDESDILRAVVDAGFPCSVRKGLF
jgi:copper chaperone CopZ